MSAVDMGQRITDEINADPREVARLRQSRASARAGRRRPFRDVFVWRPTDAEWDRFVARELAALGLTYNQLAEQARTGDYEPCAAFSTWIVIGGHPPGKARRQRMHAAYHRKGPR